MAPIGTDVQRAAYWLRNGSIVAIPTETVYGLAANAFDAAAVLKVFQAKDRPSFDPLIVHVHDRAQVDHVAAYVPPEAEALMAAFWPGPLTLVLPKHPRVPDIVTSGLDTVGIRMPAHPLALELLRSLDFPLAAPSANPFGYISPTTAQHVADQLGEEIPYILDGGACAVGVESTIIGHLDFAPHPSPFTPRPSPLTLHPSHLTPPPFNWVLYRTGGVPLEAIETVIGQTLNIPSPNTSDAGTSAKAPGMLESHYAPRKPLIVGDVPSLQRAYGNKRCAVISFRAVYPTWKCVTLAPSGDLGEAARNLFAAMRALDASDAELILAERFPDEGLGRAINDRLRRAGLKR
jgi:L-threonylcarbamoyladenylate synthase